MLKLESVVEAVVVVLLCYYVEALLLKLLIEALFFEAVESVVKSVDNHVEVVDVL